MQGSIEAAIVLPVLSQSLIPRVVKLMIDEAKFLNYLELAVELWVKMTLEHLGVSEISADAPHLHEEVGKEK